MIRYIYFTIFLGLFSELDAQHYTVDNGHTCVQTSVLRFGVIPVIGRFTEVSGHMYYDKENLEATTADIIINTISYSANNIGGEEAVKSSAFLDSNKYPEIRFKLTSLSFVKNQLIATGQVEIHGTKSSISFPVNINGSSLDLPTQKQSIGLTGSIVIDRTKFGVGTDMILPNGDIIISNEVKIQFAILGLSK